jgi:hypothetical protein
MLAARTIVAGNDHDRFGRCSGAPHFDRILDQAAIREPSCRVSLRPGRVYTASQWGSPAGLGD